MQQETRTKMHEDDIQQIKILSTLVNENRKDLKKHIKDNTAHDIKTDTKIDKLMPLVALASPDVIATIKSNAKMTESATVVAKSLMRLIGALAVILTLIWSIIKVFRLR